MFLNHITIMLILGHNQQAAQDLQTFQVGSDLETFMKKTIIKRENFKKMKISLKL